MSKVILVLIELQLQLQHQGSMMTSTSKSIGMIVGGAICGGIVAASVGYLVADLISHHRRKKLETENDYGHAAVYYNDDSLDRTIEGVGGFSNTKLVTSKNLSSFHACIKENYLKAEEHANSLRLLGWTKLSIKPLSSLQLTEQDVPEEIVQDGYNRIHYALVKPDRLHNRAREKLFYTLIFVSRPRDFSV